MRGGRPLPTVRTRATRTARERDRARREAKRRYARAVEAYREIRREQERVAEMADAAFLRWFKKREAGVATNGAAAVRLANRENYLSAETYSAEAELFAAGEALGIEDFDLDSIYEGETR